MAERTSQWRTSFLNDLMNFTAEFFIFLEKTFLAYSRDIRTFHSPNNRYLKIRVQLSSGDMMSSFWTDPSYTLILCVREQKILW